MDRAFFGSQRVSLRHVGHVRLKRPWLSRAETSVALTVLVSNLYDGGEIANFGALVLDRYRYKSLHVVFVF